MAAVELKDLVKSWGPVKVVKGLSLSIASGEFISLLGPSGCGKTTTLRMLAGLERPDSGLISVAGTTVDDGLRGQTQGGGRTFVPPERRQLGMVFQSYAVWPHKSVADNVAYPLQLQGLNRADREARVKEALGWVRLEAFADRMPEKLSGGQLQRVALARALVGKPRVLLLDEPLSNLDAALKDELRAEIASLRAKLGTTMVYVTHDQHEALALSDRVAVMNKGVLEQISSPEQLYREPTTPFVAGFVGGANVLDGVARDGHFMSGEAKLAIASGDAGPVTLVARPEEIRLTPGGPFTVRARLFLGQHTELHVVWGTLELRVTTPDAGALKPGDAVSVQLSRSRIFSR